MLKDCSGCELSWIRASDRWIEAKALNSISMNSSVEHMRDMDGSKRRVVWSPEAVADLDGIWDYYEQIAGVTAEDIVRRIHHACAVLQEHAFAGHTRDEIKASLRSISVQPFVIYYKVRVAGESEIVRVLDSRRETSSAFSKDDTY